MVKTIVLFLLFSVQLVTLAVPTATVDRSSVSENESVELEIENDKQVQAPDWQILEQDFDILGVSSSVSMQVIQGNATTLQKWHVSLMPKSSGKLTIPSLKVGDQLTAQIVIDVKKQAVSNDVTSDVFFETVLSSQQPYVQEQLIYTLRLYARYPLVESNLLQPRIDGKELQLLGKQEQRTVMKNNKRFQVFELRYLVAPEHSGKLEISAPKLRGALMVNGMSYGGGKVKRVIANGKSYTLQVRTKPSNFQGEWWLPAKKVMISQALSKDPNKIKVGDALTRTIVIEAEGVSADQLPDIKLPDVDGLNIYPNKPEVDTRVINDSIVATKIVKFAMVPTKEGDIHLPQFKLPWWDVANRSEKTAKLAAIDFRVSPGAVAASSAPTPTTSSKPDIHTEQSKMSWYVLVPFMLIGWLVAGFIWYRGRKTKTQVEQENPSLNAALKSLKKACHSGDVDQACASLLRYASVRWPNAKILNINDVANQFDDPEFQAQVKALNEHRYGQSDKTSWDGVSFFRVFSKLKSFRQNKQGSMHSDGLPPLYPG